MKHLFSIKNKIEDVYRKNPAVTGCLTRFVISFLALLIMRENIGYNPILTNILFVLAFSVICAFLPMQLMLLALIAYFIVQVFSLSVGVGVVTCILLIIAYMVYYRFDMKNGFVIILIPLLYMIRLQLLIPLVLAVTAPAGSLISVLLGVTLYFYVHYLSTNTAVIQGMAEGDEISRMSLVLSKLFTNRELWLTLLCITIVFLAVYYLKRINVNKSNLMAISIGAGIYLILILISNLILGSMTYNKLLWIVIGTLASWLLALLLSSVILPLDYNRTELLEFEDEEYKYYVRAVPKASVSKESVRIKRIYTRKQTSQAKEEEEAKT